MKKVSRGSIWTNNSKKKGFSQAIGAYAVNNGDRYFQLTIIKTGKTRVYESPAAAMRDGWSILKRAK